MLKVLLTIFYITPYFIFAGLSDSEWIIKDTGTLSLLDYAHPLDLNDNGQILVLSRNSASKDFYAITDNVNKVFILPSLSKNYPSGEYATEVLKLFQKAYQVYLRHLKA